MEKRQVEIDRLLQLPQEGDVWQLGVEQYVGRWINFAGRVWHPWMAVVYSLSHQTVVTNFPFCIAPPTEDFVFRILEGGRVPGPTSDPHRPTELQLQDDAIGHAMKPWIERLGIAFVLMDRMDAVEEKGSYLTLAKKCTTRRVLIDDAPRPF